MRRPAFNRGRWQAEYAAANGHLYAYVMNNYWFTNYLAGQGGDFTFRFAITSRPKADSVASARFGWGVSSPLQAVATGANSGGTLPTPAASLIEIAEPNVLLVGLKQADAHPRSPRAPNAGPVGLQRTEANPALVLRLWEVAGQATTAHVRLPLVPLQKARSANLVEKPQESLEVRQSAVAVPIRSRGLATVLLE